MPNGSSDSNFCVVTPYYNPLNYRMRRENYNLFIAGLKEQNIPFVPIECIFEGQEFSLPGLRTIRVVSKSVLWHKERLINLAVSTLPRSIQYVAWVDCDIIFTNPRWADDTISLLKEVSMVQLFERCIRLPRGHITYGNEGRISESFASVTNRKPEVLLVGLNARHGITGGAWATRREVLDTYGLYEYAIAGGADDYVAHAAIGDSDSDCIKSKLQYNPILVQHFLEWAHPFSLSIGGKIRAVPGDILSLWHGATKDRKYFDRHRELERLGFNPYRDIIAPSACPLEWADDTSPELRQWLCDYFSERREDG